jgi:transketolase
VRRLRAGSDVTLVSTGVESSRVFQAATLLAEGGTDAAVVHVPCLKPFDAGSLLAALGPAPLVITVEDHNVIGGLGGLVAETLAEAGTGRVLRRVGVEDTWSESAPDSELLDMFGLSARRVAETVRRHISELDGPGRATASAAASQQD